MNRSSMRDRRVLATTAVVALSAALVAVPVGPSHSWAGPAVASGPADRALSAKAAPVKAKVTHGCLASVPDPGSSQPVEICYSLFKPVKAVKKRKRVPMIMHSHGWGGSRITGAKQVQSLLRHGYGVLSFDQRGFGESGGNAYVENPHYEGADVRRLVRLISKLPWVKKDGPGDPRLGAMGGSYGGGYQFVGAFEGLRLHGNPKFDALAPEITWHSLNESLAPEGVVRAEWALALSAASLPSQALPPTVYKALTEGIVTGMWPDGSIPGTEDMERFFSRNGPEWHVRNGRKLDIPVLFGQGATDTLFPLEQGLTNWRTAITGRARKESIFVAYNGGHVLPALLPRGTGISGDPCAKKLSGRDFRLLRVKFFDEKLKGKDRKLRGYGRYHMATASNTCISSDSVAPNTSVPVAQLIVPTGPAGVPLSTEIAEGPLKLSGNSVLRGTVTALGLESRAFLGLAIGSSPADAVLVQGNVLPLREPLPVTGAQRRIELPAVAVKVPAGKKLFLLASPFSDTFVGMGSRVPGLITIDDAEVELPVVK